MAAVLYLFGGLGLAGAIVALVNAPVLMATPAITAVLTAFLLLGIGRLISLAEAIDANTRKSAEHLRALRAFAGDERANYSELYRGVYFRRERDKSISALMPNGEKKRFRNWEELYRAAEAAAKAPQGPK
jgi:hypothetical protein